MAISAKELLEKYREGTCNKREKLLVEDWFLKYGTDENIIILAEDVQRVKAEMWLVVQARRNRKIRLWPRIAGIAAAVVGMVIGIWFFSPYRHAKPGSGAPLATDIAPGKNRATLSVNGETIELSGTKNGVIINAHSLTYNDNSPVLSSKPKNRVNNLSREVEMTATTPRGGMYEFVLPDRTRVWLNSDSRISFSSRFSDRQRRVFLIGEAYFEVTKDAKRPFMVESERQQVTVLGTHFNVSAYKGEGIKTTLLEGSVRVASMQGEVEILKPNQQAVLAAGNVLAVKQIDANEAIDWKNGLFVFRKEPLEQIMKRIERWYDVKVIYKDEISPVTFSGTVSRFDKVSTLLRLLEKTRKIQFDIQNRNIIITNPNRSAN